MMGVIPEKIGQFYLGTETLPSEGQPLLYDATDLTTHAVIIGMTGSGKTGLGISLLEEASLDGIPVIAVDPKGDLGNLALNFPSLQPSDFAPYADPTVLSQTGQTVEQWAQMTVENWQSGIAQSGQSQARMTALKNANAVRLFTPGSNTGLSLALLSNFVAPELSVREDSEAYGDALDAAAAGLLALLKQNVDSLDPQHIYLTHVFKYRWDMGKTLTLADLIADIQNPPFDKMGILPVNQVFPEKSRVALAMALNNLIASPSFAPWQQGQPLDVQTLLYDAQNRAQTSVLNIAHLSDAERMFFVTLLLSNLINWMRRQQGTGTLRAIFYMDEIAGYLPPNANPASKKSFLTLLKQARAFGIGLVLASQNPIDLDYKALSNAGTWFIGRLQTAQDRARVTEGLLSANEKGVGKADLDSWFDKLGKRQFLLHNIHDNAPVIFKTRWAMSYLAGPLNKAQISTITAEEKAQQTVTTTVDNHSDGRPALLPPDIPTYYLPMKNSGGQVVHYFPTVLGIAELFYQDSKSGIRSSRELMLSVAVEDNVDWKAAETLAVNSNQLQTAPQEPAKHHEAPAILSNAKTWDEWEKSLKTVLRQNCSLSIWYNDALKVYSEPGETEEAFRNRLALPAREARDVAVMKLRQKYATKQMALNKQQITAQAATEREASQASGSLLNAGLAIGGALLSAFTGRKVLSATNLSRVATAVRRVGQVGKERQDSATAQQKLALVQQQIADLEAQLQEDINALQTQYDPQLLTLESKTINAKASDITVKTLGLLYRSLNG